ncbi:MAG: hypothetical protein Q4B64_10375 [Spirochaetales bacterium]|nr:hypothetical protein [Spirochaetales bacterium]
MTVTIKDVNISKFDVTGISVEKKCALTLDNVEVYGCRNGIVASDVCSVNLKGTSVVKNCTEFGIKLDNANAELKLEGTSVDSTQAASSSLDVFAGSKIDLYCKAGKFVRLNTVCSDVSKSDDVLTEAITAIKDFGNGSLLLIGKSTDTSVTWSIKENGITINGGSSGSTYNIKPTNTAGRVVVERSLSASASANFPLVQTSSANGAWKISSFTFRGGKNIGDSGYGGAFNISGGTFDFSSCRFESNNSGMGGAVYASGGTVSFTACTLGGGTTTGNSAGKNGGAIYATSNSATVKLLGTGNSISYNKSCTSTTISGASAFGGGAIYLASGAKCEMEGGTIQSNAVENIAVGTGAKTCGGSICVAGISSFTLKGGTIKNGSIPSSGSNRFGQDIYNEGTFRVNDASSAWTISNTNSAGSIGDVYSTGNFYSLEGQTAFSGDNAVYDNISNGNGIARGVDFICIPTSVQGFIRINVPSANVFYSAFSYMGNFSKGCVLYCGKSTDTETEYDCGTSPTIPLLVSSAEYTAQSLEIKPTASSSTSKNKILIKSSLVLRGKGTFVLQNVLFSSSQKKISAECDSGSKLTLNNTTVKNCGGIDVNDGVILVYDGNSLVGSHDVPITLNGTAKIKLDSVLTSTDNEDFDGYIGYVKLGSYPPSGSKTIFSGSKIGDYAKYFYILPDESKNLYELDNSSAVVIKTVSDSNPKTLMDWQALLPATPAPADYPQNGDTVACKTQKDLEIMADWVNNNKSQLKTVKVVLQNDIELKGEWTPIGKFTGNMNDSTFRGVFDGNNKTISGLNAKYSATNPYPALFQRINSGIYGYCNVTNKDGVIMNLTVKGTSECAGIVGISERGIIRNCISEVVVTAENADCAAGICGKNSGEIGNCTNKGVVTGRNNVGGIAGINYSGFSSTPVYNCENLAAVSGTDRVGGIVGNYTSRIIHCRNKGAVTTSGNYAGGIAGSFSGMSDATVKRGLYDCWNEGNVSAGNYAGGIIGVLTGSDTDAYEVVNVLQKGTITSSGTKGLIYGKVESTNVKDGCLFYVNNPGSLSISGSGTYDRTNADTNFDGTSDGGDVYSQQVSSAIEQKMKEWLDLAKSDSDFLKVGGQSWTNYYIDLSDWPTVGAVTVP